MWTRLIFGLACAALIAVASTMGCGNDLVIGGTLRPSLSPSSTTPTPCPIGAPGDQCSVNSDCCSNSCNVFIGVCN